MNDYSLEVLKYNVDLVKKYLNDINIDIPFFIAGGSVFSILNKSSKFTDIDVFVYNESDARKLKDSVELAHCTNCVTNHAITVFLREIQLQFVTAYYGTPTELFKTFDFNCSRAAITSTYELVIDDSFSNVIEFPEYIRSNTLFRYNKYIKKGAIDKTDVILQLYDVFCDDITKTYETYYTDTDTDLTGIHILNTELHEIRSGYRCQYIHDKLTDMYKSFDSRMDLFTTLTYLYRVQIINPVPELTLYKMRKNAKLGEEKMFYISDKELDVVQNVYPEHIL